MNFSRKTILVVGAALLAACGDKVTVQEYTPPPPTSKVNFVEVTPATATVSPSASITFTAAVNADAGVATSVTWFASAGTITTAGVFTAPATANPGISVCATSTVDTGKKGCATVVVSAPPSTFPATVSINSITQGGTFWPVNPATIKNQIDVTLNINPGTQVISKVELLVGGKVACTQSFTPAQSAALRFSADEAVAAQTTFPQVVCSVNTAAYDTTTGVPTYMNGTQTVQAKLYTVAGGSTSAASASVSQNLTFTNIDTYAAKVVTSGTTANVLNTAGYRYDRGGLDVSVLPILYSGRTIASATLYFGSVCDSRPTGQRNTALTAPATGASAWTKTGWATSTPSTGNEVNYLTNYEFQAASNLSTSCQALNATGETVAVTAVDSNGDAVFAQAAPVNVSAANSLRLDNRAPAVGSPFFMANPNGRQNGWINDKVSLVGSSSSMSATSNNWLFSAPSVALNGQTARDYGQGSYTRFLRIAEAPTQQTDEARAATPSSAPTLPAPSAANNTYCAIATAQDALGNETARAASGACGAVVVATNAAANTGLTSQLFGVDIAKPVITAGSSTDNATYLDANERRGAAATMTNNFGVSVVDTGTVGNSGMLTNRAVMGTVILRNDANTALTAATKCVVGVIDSNDNVTCLAAPVNSNPAPGLPWVVVSPTAANSAGAGTPGATAVTGAVAPGYYTYVAYARDAAGNESGTITKVVAFDVLGNVPALTSAVFNTPLTGGSVTFSATASDNFDLWKSAYALTYGAVLAGPVVYPSTQINTFNGTQMFSNVAAGITIPNFVRQVETIATNAPVVIGGTSKPTALNGTVTDQSNQASVVANTVIPGASVTTGVSYTAAIPAQLVNSFAISNVGPTAISDGAGPAAAVNPLSVTLNADVFGPTATFNPPFVRVDFYAFVGGNLVQIGTTTSVVSTDDGSAFGRKHRYSISWTPGTLYAPGGTVVYAMGVNAAGDALVTPANAAIVITNP